jgi:multidrug resistance efflux pump
MSFLTKLKAEFQALGAAITELEIKVDAEAEAVEVAAVQEFTKVTDSIDRFVGLIPSPVVPPAASDTAPVAAASPTTLSPAPSQGA